MSDSAVALADALDAKVLLSVLAQVKGGDFTARMPLEWTGVAGKVADGLNDVIIANQALEAELARVSRVVGKQGELSQRVVLGGWSQCWRARRIRVCDGFVDFWVKRCSSGCGDWARSLPTGRLPLGIAG